MAEKKKKGLVTKEMPITSIIESHPESIPVFMKHGFHCLGCAAAQFESLEQGAMAHGIDPDKLLSDINKAAASPPEKQAGKKQKAKQ